LQLRHHMAMEFKIIYLKYTQCLSPWNKKQMLIKVRWLCERAKNSSTSTSWKIPLATFSLYRGQTRRELRLANFSLFSKITQFIVSIYWPHVIITTAWYIQYFLGRSRWWYNWVIQVHIFIISWLTSGLSHTCYTTACT
jgi:hypothetical protein